MAGSSVSWSERAVRLLRRMNSFYSAGSSRCQCWHFSVGGMEVGLVPPAVLKQLRRFPEVFSFKEEKRLELNPGLASYHDRSSAVDRVLQRLREEERFTCLQGWRDEKYEVMPQFSDPPLMCMERAATSLFGVKRYGVHVNGFTRQPDGQLAMWVARRSLSKQTYPGLLDNMVAGGIGSQKGIRDTLIKECAEEASIPECIAAAARPVGTVSYTYEDGEGVFAECQFVFDLEVSSDFSPSVGDGEVHQFYLWPIEKVKDALVTEEFKQNCALVVLDFLIRHSYLHPDTEPNYLELVVGLHRPL
ncbi:hypothetical protein AOXY_G32689 [Acipenser oxyrinchus oxyrinchus]|uniref:Nudix hydrolase domain-containing protein n=1 Tax=Acipenser oxyrinchus oxyrinchus TaxID=40147 RepID=A0AAD8CHS2_ACIOX|nr:hypothetical protein AOXY_G32689 [Acipenser oxyrinchus oxyrinchus]